MTCKGCGNTNAYHIKIRWSQKDGMRESCTDCGGFGIGDAYEPDVYWPGHPYKSEHLCDALGNPYLLTSKQHKARVMQEMGVREAGDRNGGSRALPHYTWREGVKRAQR